MTFGKKLKSKYCLRILACSITILSYSFNLSSQDIILRFNDFNHSSAQNTFDIDTLNIVPEVSRTTTNYNLDLTYLLYSTDSLNYWFIRMGYFSYRSNILVSDQITLNGILQRRVTNSNFDQREINTSIGVLNSVNIGHSLSLLFGPEIHYKNIYYEKRILKRDFYDGNNSFLGFVEKKTVPPNTNIFGIGFRSALYFSVNHKISIGLEKNIVLLAKIINGTSDEKRSFYDAASMELSIIDNSYKENDKSIFLQDYLSIGVRYSF